MIVRAHAIDLEPVLERALPRYPRLFTEAKYNGESLTTRSPRGAWQEKHRRLASLGSVHIVNVHILANLEPFRYGAVSFIQRCAQAIKHRLDAGGLHLYPLFYWEWPHSPDRLADARGFGSWTGTGSGTRPGIATPGGPTGIRRRSGSTGSPG